MRLHIRVTGRPAPQGSKGQGAHGQLLEASPYLPAWRTAVRTGVFEAYREGGVNPAALPLFPAPTAVHIEQCWFLLLPEQCRAEGTDRPTGTPDIDKLLRATLDALGGAHGKTARVFADDSQVVRITNISKQYAARAPGAIIVISDEGV